MEAQSRFLQYVSMSFDVATSDVLTTVAAGAALVIADRAQILPGAGFVRLLAAQRITHMELPAAVLAALPEPGRLPDLATVVVGGEVCPAAVVGRWGAQRRLLNAYGTKRSAVRRGAPR